MLKNDTLKNGTSRTGLYGSAPPGSSAFSPKKVNISKIVQNRETDRVNFPFIKSHIIRLCVEVREHLYILKIKPTK